MLTLVQMDAVFARTNQMVMSRNRAEVACLPCSQNNQVQRLQPIQSMPNFGSDRSRSTVACQSEWTRRHRDGWIVQLEYWMKVPLYLDGSYSSHAFSIDQGYWDTSSSSSNGAQQTGKAWFITTSAWIQDSGIWSKPSSSPQVKINCILSCVHAVHNVYSWADVNFLNLILSSYLWSCLWQLSPDLVPQANCLASISGRKGLREFVVTSRNYWLIGGTTFDVERISCP